ncbi:MAG: aspartyl/glutamyl-tRNA amidotransferase subunit A, partial [Candidatus Omnitrophica bacterium]|nr:aspartyl/glutamyl-tRNA amidotransferase subunit A [Candidatus Omnitrophota bacterium]
AFASSLDQIGPFTRTVEDAALLLEVIAGHDPKDSTSADVKVPEYTKSLKQSVKGMKIGLPKEFYAHTIDPDVSKSIERAKEIFEKAGAEIVEISLPHTDYAVSVYYVVGPCEASSNLSRFDGIRYGRRTPNADDLSGVYEMSRAEGFGKEAKRRILLGTFALSSGYYDAYYLKAMKTRRKIIDDFNQAFNKVDIILTPTAPTGAFKIGEKTSDPLSMYLSDIFTISANLAGVPGISVPCGVNSEGMPLGMQLMAKPFDEETMLRAAYCYEQQSGFGGQIAANYRTEKS